MSEALLQPFPMLPGRRAQAWRHQDAFRRPRHFHDEPEINLVVRGTALLGVGTKQMSLRQGHAVCFAPGQDHVLLDASPDLELFVFALRAELADTALRRPVAAAQFQLANDALSGSAELLSSLEQLSCARVHETRLSDLFRSLTEGSGALGSISRRALCGLANDPAMGQATLAQRLRTPPSELSRHFHRDLGVRMVEYRSRLRLMRFVALVDEGRAYTDAALAADFGSYAQCHRVFRRALGCSPTAYFNGVRQQLDEATLAKGGRPALVPSVATCDRAPERRML